MKEASFKNVGGGGVGELGGGETKICSAKVCFN